MWTVSATFRRHMRRPKPWFQGSSWCVSVSPAQISDACSPMVSGVARVTFCFCFFSFFPLLLDFRVDLKKTKSTSKVCCTKDFIHILNLLMVWCVMLSWFAYSISNFDVSKFQVNIPDSSVYNIEIDIFYSDLSKYQHWYFWLWCQ